MVVASALWKQEHSAAVTDEPVHEVARPERLRRPGARCAAPAPRSRPAGRAAAPAPGPASAQLNRRSAARCYGPAPVVQVGPEHPARPGTSDPSRFRSHPLTTWARARARGPPSHTAVVLEAGQTGQRSATARTGPSGAAVATSSPTARGPVPLRVVTSRSPRPSWGRSELSGKNRPSSWKPAQTPKTTAPRSAARSRVPSSRSAVARGPADRPPRPDAVEIGGGEGTPRVRLDQLGVDAAPRCPARQDQPFPPSPLRAE